jgi:hypothetical protein
MAVNKSVGDNARKGAVKKRTQLKNPLTKTSTKRNKEGGQFTAVKKTRRSSRALGKRSSGQVFYRNSDTELRNHFRPLPLCGVELRF